MKNGDGIYLSKSMRPSSSRTYAFLANPVSGNGQGQRLYDDFPALMESFGIPAQRWSRHLTDRHDMTGQVIRLLQTHDRLLVAGGDGTISMTLEGALRADCPDAAVGFFPMGTGNDLARELRTYQLFQKAGAKGLLKAFLEEDRPRPIDLWSVGDSSCLMANYLSFGLDAKATAMFTAHRDARGGTSSSVTANKLDYIRSAFTSLETRLPTPFKATLSDGSTQWSEDYSGSKALVVLNIASYASGNLECGRTRPDDGNLTILAFPTFLHYWPLVLASRIPSLRRTMARYFLPRRCARNIVLEWNGPVDLQIDGEPRPDLGARGHLDIRLRGQIPVLLGPRIPWFAREGRKR